MKQKIADKIKQEEEWKRQRDIQESEFNTYFKEGATHVTFHNGMFYFWGDVSHCGKENIFHNARELKIPAVRG